MKLWHSFLCVCLLAWLFSFCLFKKISTKRPLCKIWNLTLVLHCSNVELLVTAFRTQDFIPLCSVSQFNLCYNLIHARIGDTWHVSFPTITIKWLLILVILSQILPITSLISKLICSSLKFLWSRITSVLVQIVHNLETIREMFCTSWEQDTALRKEYVLK